ncbi:MAG: hypothetical protein VCC00_15465, partial [Deltaproteobacteria bacterium]
VCSSDLTGLLLARVSPERGEVEGKPRRGVFAAGDAWLDTGDLVRCDNDGDFWLLDHLRDVVHTGKGAVATIPVEDTLAAELSFIDLAAVFGVELDGEKAATIVAAITLRPGEEFDLDAFSHVVHTRLLARERPRFVRVLDELPLTSGHRIRKRALREAGLDSTAGTDHEIPAVLG